MAKISESKMRVFKAMGITLTKEQEETLKSKDGEVELPDDFFDDFLNDYLPQIKKNQQASIHTDYEKGIEKFKEVIGEDGVSEVQKRKGYEKLDALSEQFKNVLKKVKMAQREDDPEALKKAQDKLIKLEGDLEAATQKYSSYVSPEDHKTALDKQRKRALDAQIKEAINSRDDLDEFAKKQVVIDGITSGVYRSILDKGYVLDYESGHITDSDGQPVSKSGKQLNYLSFLDTLTEEFKKKGGDRIENLPRGGNAQPTGGGVFLIGSD